MLKLVVLLSLKARKKITLTADILNKLLPRVILKALIDICHHSLNWCCCHKAEHKNVLFAVADSEIFCKSR